MRASTTASELRHTWGYRLSVLVCMSAFLGGDIYLLFEIRWLEATFDAAWLVFAASALGAVIYLVMRRPLTALFDATGDEAWAAHILVVVGLTAATVAAGSDVNRRTAENGPEIQSFDVLAKGHKTARPRAPERWDVLIAVGDDRERIEISQERWEGVEVGMTITFPVVRGGLGFSFVDRSDQSGPHRAPLGSDP